MNIRNLARLIVLFSVLNLAVSAQEKNFPEWKPPPSRDKAITLFAPKVINLNNIFKGEAEQWLTDAVIKLESPSLSPIDNKEVSNYVSNLGKCLVKFSESPKKNFQFVVTDSSEVNAFNIGGGRVYICRGLLEDVKNEDELACIIGHEIGHDTFLHIPKTVTRQLFWMNGITKIKSAHDAEKALQTLFEKYENSSVSAFMETLLGFRKPLEIEADRAGFYIAYKAGYNPMLMSSFFERYEQREKKGNSSRDPLEGFLEALFASHPSDAERTRGFKWEGNLVKIPSEEKPFISAAFTAMKTKL